MRRDIGGDFAAYRRQTERYRKSGRHVQLLECRSACTLALSLPNVCVYPRSILRFNHPWRRGSGTIDHAASDELFRSYPAAVRKRLGYLTRKFVSLEGRELIALGIADCRGKTAGNTAGNTAGKSLARPEKKAGVLARFYRRMKIAILGKPKPAGRDPSGAGADAAGHTLNLEQRITVRAMPLGVAVAAPQSLPQSLPEAVPLPPPRPQSIASTQDDPRGRAKAFAYSSLPPLIRGAAPVLPSRFTAYAPLR